MNCKEQEVLIDKDNMLEVVYQTLSVQKEHSRSQKVPTINQNQRFKYQFRTLKKGIFFSRAGTLASAMTSLYTMICITVTIAITYICPSAKIVKYPAKRIKVHNVRTLKLTTFFCRSSTVVSGTTDNGCFPINSKISWECYFIHGGRTRFSFWIRAVGRRSW